MELMWLVYGISVLSNIGVVSGLVLVFSMVTAIGAGIVYAASEGEAKFPFIKSLIATIVLSTAIVVVVPSEKTMYTMAGAYATQKVAEAPATREVADKVLKIINEKLDSMVKK